MIDLCFTPFSLVTAQEQQQSTIAKEKREKRKQITRGRCRWNCWFRLCKCPVETNGWIKTIVDIVCAPGSTKSCRKEAENLSVRLVTRSTVKTRRWIDASGHGIHCVFAQRSREIGRTDARSSIAGGMFVTRSAVETGEFGIADVSKWATTFGSFVVDGRNPPGNTRGLIPRKRFVVHPQLFPIYHKRDDVFLSYSSLVSLLDIQDW